MTPDVSICIPTYRSAAFIARTLDCARAQTHETVRIVVSVDPADDDTAAVCARHAEADRRIDLVVQERRLGWSANANAALDRAGTEYAFIYFHDDIIEPTYAERLVGALSARPDAVSAHCDLIDFGLIDRLRESWADRSLSSSRAAVSGPCSWTRQSLPSRAPAAGTRARSTSVISTPPTRRSRPPGN